MTSTRMSETSNPLPLRHLGEPLLRFDQLDSTNNYARELAAQGASEGTAVLARQQTAGRGRQGRTWISPAATGLYLSVILRPQIAPSGAAFIPLAAAIAVAETLTMDFQTPADIKYPNDVLVNGRKICGILVEAAVEGERLLSMVLGIGVNVGQRQFPEELTDTATSLFLASGLTHTPEEFARPLLARLSHWYAVAIDQPERILSRWEELSSYANNCAIRILSPEATVEGITRGLTPAGALRVELDDGEIRDIVAGEISLRKNR